MKTCRVLAALLFALASAILAHDALTNESIVKMVKSGLGEALIVNMVQSQPGMYSITPDELVKLKEQGVPESVLAAMIAKGTVTASGAAPAAGVSAPGDPNDPLVRHDSGIWLYTKDADGNPQMVALERAAYQGSKTGGIMSSALTYGIKKAKTKAVLPGAHASLQVPEPNPVFYFYFEDRAAGLGKTYFGLNSLSNPNQFALIKLEVAKSNRETVIGQFGVTGTSSGTSEKAMVGFKSERVRTGLYKVTLSAPLQPGEYCFLASSGFMGAYGAGAAGAADIFDFGIQ